MDVQTIIDGILRKEGGFVNNPDDSGGPTNYGITLAVYRRYKPNATIDDLKRMMKIEAFSIYENQYYVEPGFHKVFQLSQSVAVELTDTGVNMGPEVAIKFLQRCLNVFNYKQSFYKDLTVDGVLGPNTLKALELYLQRRGSMGEVVLLKGLNCLQGAKYISLAETREKDETFVYGWISNRIHI